MSQMFKFSLMGSSILQAVGITTLCALALRASNLLYSRTYSSTLPKYARNDSWAIITGATDGIGLAFTQYLAAYGFNLILHGRNPEKLASVATSTRRSHPDIETKIYVADAFTHSTFDDLAALLGGTKVTVLVNNIGKNTMAKRYTNLADASESDITNTLMMNTHFITFFTRAVIPHLVRSQPSLMLNIGSAVGPVGFPGLSVYAGSKGYIESFSKSLALEFADMGADVSVHNIVIGLVASGSHTRDASFSVPSARAVAKATMGSLGRGEVSYAPYGLHAAQQWLIKVLPRSWAVRALVKAKRDDQGYEKDDKI